MSKAHPCAQSLSNSLGTPGLILEVCEILEMVVTSGAGASDGVTIFFTVSMLLIIEYSCADVSLVEWVASACLDSCFSISWSQSTYIAIEVMVFWVF
jgi:hypothetical protein